MADNPNTIFRVRVMPESAAAFRTEARHLIYDLRETAAVAGTPGHAPAAAVIQRAVEQAAAASRRWPLKGARAQYLQEVAKAAKAQAVAVQGASGAQARFWSDFAKQVGALVSEDAPPPFEPGVKPHPDLIRFVRALAVDTARRDHDEAMEKLLAERRAAEQAAKK